MSKDLLLFESGSGGDILISNNDMTLVETLFQQVYIRLFGGNTEANTTGSEIEGRQRDDWWGNSLLFSDTPEKQFNSNTERVLDNVALNTSGRIDIKRAVESDLNSLSNISDITVNVVILAHDKVQISVMLQKPDGEEDKILQFIWDNARQEVIIDRTI